MQTKNIKQILSVAKSNLSKAPNGELRISKSNGSVQYYNVRTYLSKKNMELIKQLAQKQYDREVVQLLEKQITDLQNVEAKYSSNNIEHIIDGFSPEMKKLITPYAISDEEFAKQWKGQKYLTRDSDGIYITANNERVRSKSEVMIADRLLLYKIPYRYEAALKIIINGAYHYFWPDFTVLNIRTRQEYIIEHFGMMDNPEYAINALSKINTYAENGYIQGKNILYTFESSKQPLNMNSVKSLITTYLM